MGYQTPEVSILLVTDKEIQELNHKYRSYDSATDVLAFSMKEGDYGNINPNLLGDVVISVETCQRQAVERDDIFENEFAFLLIHGILHLAGYDHIKKKEASIMEEKTREISKFIQVNSKQDGPQ